MITSSKSPTSLYVLRGRDSVWGRALDIPKLALKLLSVVLWVFPGCGWGHGGASRLAWHGFVAQVGHGFRRWPMEGEGRVVFDAVLWDKSCVVFNMHSHATDGQHAHSCSDNKRRHGDVPPWLRGARLTSPRGSMMS